MKGIVLAGGLGSRLHPLTRVTNKHLLPVYDRPMIFYPIQTLVSAGIKEILIVTGGQNAGDFLRLLSNGKDFGLKHLNYAYQEGEGGIADALRLAEHFTDGDSLCVVLGDNVIQAVSAAQRKDSRRTDEGAHLLLKAVHDPHRFGCPEIVDGQIIHIEEKPKKPKSNYAVTGLYFFDQSVFEKIGRLKPSGARRAGGHRHQQHVPGRRDAHLQHPRGLVDRRGTFDSLRRATELVASSNSSGASHQEEQDEDELRSAA